MFTRHEFLLVTVKEWLKSVLNYRSYPKYKTGYPFFWTTLHILLMAKLRLAKLQSFMSSFVIMLRAKNYENRLMFHRII